MPTAIRSSPAVYEPPPAPFVGRARRFSVAEYHTLIDAGIFASDERFELLEGWIVQKMVKNPPHEVAIGLTGKALSDRLLQGWHVRVQSAITLADSEPEPDLAVVRGAIRDYLDHHPRPDEIALVVEVAESSLRDDRGIKARIYARAGLPVYWVINLVDRQIEAMTDPTGPDASPRYRSKSIVPIGGAVPISIDGHALGPIDAGDLIP